MAGGTLVTLQGRGLRPPVPGLADVASTLSPAGSGLSSQLDLIADVSGLDQLGAGSHLGQLPRLGQRDPTGVQDHSDHSDVVNRSDRTGVEPPEGLARLPPAPWLEASDWVPTSLDIRGGLGQWGEISQLGPVAQALTTLVTGGPDVAIRIQGVPCELLHANDTMATCKTAPAEVAALMCSSRMVDKADYGADTGPRVPLVFVHAFKSCSCGHGSTFHALPCGLAEVLSSNQLQSNMSSVCWFDSIQSSHSHVPTFVQD